MPKTGGKRSRRTRTTSNSQKKTTEQPTAGINPDLIYELRQIRWTANHLRAKVGGIASVFDGRTADGKAAKQMVVDVQASLALARDGVGKFLRKYGDEPLDDDLRTKGE